ncbi:MAG: polymer-forming cytoskeletal protein [Hyphomicrobiaceae bacterium]
MFTRNIDFDEPVHSKSGSGAAVGAATPPMPRGKSEQSGGSLSSGAAMPDGLVVVGKGTNVHGTIGECRRLEVHGILEGDAIAEEILVCAGGGIKGTVQADRADILGVFEGTLIVHEHLELGSTAEVTGDVSYRSFAMKAGARLSGNIICQAQSAEPESEEQHPESADQENVIKTDIWSTVPPPPATANGNRQS